MSDPYFSSVSLLLHCEGADASTSFVDSSPIGATVTAGGNAKLSTTGPLTGSASCLLDGTGDYVSIAHSAAFNFGTGDFTVELQFKANTLTNAPFLWHKASGTAGANTGWFIEVDSSHIYAGKGFDGGNFLTIPQSLSAGTAYRIALTRTGSSIEVFLDGASIGGPKTLSSSSFDNSSPTIIGGGGGSFFTASTYSLDGRIDEVRITKGVRRYTGTYTPSGGPFEEVDPNAKLLVLGPLGQARFFLALPAVVTLTNSGPLGIPKFVSAVSSGFVLVGGPLGTPAIRAGLSMGVRALTRGPLGAARIQGYTDFTSFIVESTLKFVADFDTPDGAVRIPISSWQATLQTNGASYVQCVVPAVTPWLDTLTVATGFRILRRGVLLNGSVIYVEIAAGPMQTVALNQGSFNFTATISGYGPAYDPNTDPDPLFDRTLIGPRQRSTSTNSLRVQCSIDWLLKPSMRAWLNGDSFIVSYMNLYATSDGDVHMEVGSGAS